MARIRSIVVSGLFASVCLAEAKAAHGEEQTPVGEIPVLVHAGDDRVLLDDMPCLRAACEGRVSAGRHRVTVQVVGDGQWITDLVEDIEISAPTEIRVERPGFIRRTALVTTIAGAAITTAGLLVPLFVCSGTSSTDPMTGQVKSSNPCRDLPTPLQIGWIAGIGVGITLALIGGVALGATSNASHVRARRWAVVPVIAPSSGAQGGSTIGVGFVLTL
jgi:hypothetical protein